MVPSGKRDEGLARDAWRAFAQLAGLGAAGEELVERICELDEVWRQSEELVSVEVGDDAEPALVHVLERPVEAAGSSGGDTVTAGQGEAASSAAFARAPQERPAPHRLTIAEACRLMRRRELSPVELVEDCLKRIDSCEPLVQAWVQVLRERALEEAQEAERAMRSGEAKGPVHGIPFGVKDIYHVAGVPTRAGSASWEVKPSQDAEAVSRLRRAGAILLGKTTTTVFAFRDPAPTRNPWSPAHTPGGSSSGSAAAVAARMVPLALGTQTAGSLSRPASYCGVVALKPTYGLVSRRGVVPVAWSLDHVGAFTLTVEDQALVLAALCGEDPGDPATWARSAPASRDVRPVVGVPDHFFDEQAEPATWERFMEALKVLESLGWAVETVPLPPTFEAVQAAHAVIMQAEAAAVHLERLRTNPSLLPPSLRKLTMGGALVPATVYVRAQQVRRLFQRQLLALFDRVGVLATPATPGPAPHGLQWTGPYTFNAPFSAAGVPTLTVPMGWVEGALPVGLQLVAAPFAEDRLLALGVAYQSATDWHRLLPPL